MCCTPVLVLNLLGRRIGGCVARLNSCVGLSWGERRVSGRFSDLLWQKAAQQGIFPRLRESTAGGGDTGLREKMKSIKSAIRAQYGPSSDQFAAVKGIKV